MEAQLVEDVELHGPALASYMQKAIQRKREKKDDASAPLANWTNMYVNFASASHPTCSQNILGSTQNHAPKFASILAKVLKWNEANEKCVIHISHKTGYKALRRLLEDAGKKHNFCVASLSERADYNQQNNTRGERYAVLLADADQGGESIEFKCVRHHLLVDVPEMHSDFVQRASRSVRTDSHADVPLAERQVRFHMQRAVLPEFAQSEIGAFVLWTMCGWWGGRKQISPASEPEPSELEEAAMELTVRFLEQDWVRVQHLRDNVKGALAAVKDAGLESKLKQRMDEALAAISYSDAQLRVAQALEQTTIDQRRFDILHSQAHSLAPAAAKVRHLAVDSGFY